VILRPKPLLPLLSDSFRVEIDPRIYSDNGTIFVGAHKQIQELYDMYNDPQVQSEIKNFLRELEISWSFIPPNAPHFGGL